MFIYILSFLNLPLTPLNSTPLGEVSFLKKKKIELNPE